MKFCEYQNFVNHLNANLIAGDSPYTREELVSLVRSGVFAADDAIKSEARMASTVLFVEEDWMNIKRPYYDIYPAMMPLINSLDLEFPFDAMKVPYGLSSLLLRFPVDTDYNLKTILFYILRSDEVSSIICMGNYYDRRFTSLIEMKENVTVQQALDAVAVYDDTVENEALKLVVRVISAICLIGEDPDIVSPQVLTGDEPKLTDENRERLLDKAKRRGKVGFSFGKDLDSVPHARRWHMYWQAYGPKFSLRRFRKRKGSIIHRDKLINVPSGFEEK